MHYCNGEAVKLPEFFTGGQVGYNDQYVRGK
jgi:hypothetical protein